MTKPDDMTAMVQGIDDAIGAAAVVSPLYRDRTIAGYAWRAGYLFGTAWQERPPFARLKAPQRPSKASWADQVDALLGPQASPEEMERRFLKAHARIAELAGG